MMQGLWKSEEGIPARLSSMGNRIYMKATLDVLKMLFFTSCLVHELFDAATFIPTKLAHAMYEARYT